MQAGRRRKAVSKPLRKLRLKNRLHFQSRVLGVDRKGRMVTARMVAKHAKPLEERRQQRRLEQEAKEEADDPSYIPGDAIVTITSLSSSLSSED